MRLKYIFPMCKIDLCVYRSFHLCQKKSSKYSQHLYSNLNFINHFYISFHRGIKQIFSAVLGSVQYEVSGINQTVICIRQQALPILVFCLTVCKAFGRGIWSRAALLSGAPASLRAWETSQACLPGKGVRPRCIWHSVYTNFWNVSIPYFGAGPFSQRHTILKFPLDFLPTPSPGIFIQLQKQQRKGLVNRKSFVLTLKQCLKFMIKFMNDF